MLNLRVNEPLVLLFFSYWIFTISKYYWTINFNIVDNIFINNEPADKRGCVIVYEQPIPDPPQGLYKIGYDPVRQDTGTSLAGVIVYKSVHRNSYYHNNIVAIYRNI